MIEVERKYWLSRAQVDAVLALMEQWGQREAPVRQVDRVYLFQATSFDDFRHGQPVLRLRSESDTRASLTLKRAINGAGDTVEHEIAVGSAEVTEELLGELGYLCVVVVSKLRTITRAWGMTFALDHVDGLGDFLEIEVLADDDGSAAVLGDQVTAKAAEMGLTGAELESRKYDVLLAHAGGRTAPLGSPCDG